MKLYFYILDTNYSNGESNLRFEECEVVEKPKTYKPVNKFPDGVYAAYVRKEDIGHISGYSHNIVVLEESNADKAKELFSGHIENAIRIEQQKIDRFNMKLSAVRSFVG